ncbi:class I SAM-dependent methyltransferase [bacterium]|jgi:ubiquinone/menaquinone biosynthesis C-methylase UbiE|nr:class I SAM-dependent methyltransferase [bacterium]
MKDNNIDKNTIQSFGDEWSRMDQGLLSNDEKNQIFNDYFSMFPLNGIGKDALGFDMGCGSGRWASIVAPMVKKLYCIDASVDAINVAKNNLSCYGNIEYVISSVNKTELKDKTFDFGYSLGVLHHLPDTVSALKSCSRLLKKNSPFLVYLYYSFDNKPFWYKLIWKVSEVIRKAVNKTPPSLKIIITNLIGVFVYFPLSRVSLVIEKLGLNVDNFPLSYYRDKSLYTMRTDSRDRFGTPLEKRFSKKDIKKMLELASFYNISFSDSRPYWVALAYKK